MGVHVACELCTYLVFVQGSRAGSCGKRLCDNRRENSLDHNSGYQWFKKIACSFIFIKYKYLHVKIAS